MTKKNRKNVVWLLNRFTAATVILLAMVLVVFVAAMCGTTRFESFGPPLVIMAGVTFLGFTVCVILLVFNGVRHGAGRRSRLGIPGHTTATGDVRRPDRPEGVKKR